MMEEDDGLLLAANGSTIASIRYEKDPNAFSGRIYVSAAPFARNSGPYILVDAQNQRWTVELIDAPKNEESWVTVTFRAA